MLCRSDAVSVGASVGGCIFVSVCGGGYGSMYCLGFTALYIYRLFEFIRMKNKIHTLCLSLTPGDYSDSKNNMRTRRKP